jgi:glycogen(starch) synthase
LWAADLTLVALRFRPDVVMLVDSPYPFFFAPLRALGVRVVVTLHCALWPAGYPPDGASARMVNWAKGWFFRNVPDAILVISPECERQVWSVARSLRSPIVQYRPRYRACLADPPSAVPGRPFRVLFAGRIERNKGVFDVVELAARLDKRRPGDFYWTICGTGPAEAALSDAIRESGVCHCVVTRGQLQAQQLVSEYASCDAVLVPTTSRFAEGLNKVAVEAVLAGRPVIISETTHARDVLGEAAVSVAPGDLEGFQRALEHLADDGTFYKARCRAVARAAKAFLGSTISYEAVVERTLRSLLAGQL